VTFSEADFDKKMENGDYVWQDVWSRELTEGFMVAPPVDAKCKYDYKRPLSSGEFEAIRAGSVRLASGHFYNDFDISGRAGKQTAAQANSIDDEMLVMREAMKRGIKNMISITPEKVNGAVHVNLIRK